MTNQPDHTISSVRFSTDDVPSARRLEFWRERFMNSAVRANVEPRSAEKFKARALLEAVPGLSILSNASSAASIDRTAQLLDDGDDALVLISPWRGRMTVTQRGRSVILGPREGVLLLHREPARVSHNSGHFRCLIVPRLAIAGAVRDLEDSTASFIPAGAPGLRLLLHYTSGISAELPRMSERASGIVGAHVHDLIAAVASPGGDSRHGKIRHARGVRAARLAVMKADVIACIGQSEVTVHDLAVRHRVTPRTIQRLFEEEGSTFSAFKLEQQLFYARRLIGVDSGAYPTVADIAYAAGFSDLSYFHRAFRRRFGMTPAELRAQATGKDGGNAAER